LSKNKWLLLFALYSFDIHLLHVQEEDKVVKKIYKEVEFEVDVKFHLVSSIMSFIPVSKLILSFRFQIFATS